MTGKVFIRALLIPGVLAAATCAQATISIYLASTGTATEAVTPTINASENVAVQLGGAGALSTLSYSLDAGTGLGSGSYSGAGGTLDFSFAINPDSITEVLSSESVDGDWTQTGGTMGYAGLTLAGTLDFNYLSTGSGTAESGTLFSGVTPEPAPFAVMGLGVVGLLIRRRRKA